MKWWKRDDLKGYRNNCWECSLGPAWVRVHRPQSVGTWHMEVYGCLVIHDDTSLRQLAAAQAEALRLVKVKCLEIAQACEE